MFPNTIFARFLVFPNTFLSFALTFCTNRTCVMPAHIAMNWEAFQGKMVQFRSKWPGFSVKIAQYVLRFKKND